MFRARIQTKDNTIAETIAELRPVYEALLAGGTDKFFEPRREDCPVCGSRELRVRLRNTDLLQNKPGRFTLEQCTHCGHIFQNPRLSPAGLAFYYRDFYDGIGTASLGRMFATSGAIYVDRARAVAKFASRSGGWMSVPGTLISAVQRKPPGQVPNSTDSTSAMALRMLNGRVGSLVNSGASCRM